MKIDEQFDTEGNIHGNENLLTEAQKRSLTSSLFLFEKSLRKVSRLLSEENEVGILYTRKIQLSPQKRCFIQSRISQTLNELAEFAKKMGLCTTEESVEREIIADMSISWENIEECRSKRLQKYGNLNPYAAQIVDPVVDHFSNIAIGLKGLIAENLQDNALQETED